MKIQPIRSEDDYNKALANIEEQMNRGVMSL